MLLFVLFWFYTSKCYHYFKWCVLCFFITRSLKIKKLKPNQYSPKQCSIYTTLSQNKKGLQCGHNPKILFKWINLLVIEYYFSEQRTPSSVSAVTGNEIKTKDHTLHWQYILLIWFYAFLWAGPIMLLNLSH